MNNTKNLIVIHLESVNSLLFMSHREWFPNIDNFLNKCTYFDNYYSTATSTNMVITDLVYGSMYKDEKLSNPREIIKTENTGLKSIFEIMEENGKYSEGILWPNDSNTRLMDDKRILGNNIKIKRYKDYKLFINELDKIINQKNSFALFLLNLISHISYNDSNVSKSKDMYERWKMGFYALDKWFGKIISLLEKYNRLDETVILIYGDHGDDCWGHGFHNGYTHAIEPYNNMIHTPLAIYNLDWTKKEINHKLISTIDLKSILLSIIYDMTDNIMIDNGNKYIYARNRYANQSVKRYSFNKSYVVSDGEYLLMVSSNGLELYNNVMDMCNTCNILEFFKIHKNGKIEYNENFGKAQSRHFLDFFTNKEIMCIKARYDELYKELHNYVDNMYSVGNVEHKKINDELHFDKINYIHKYNLFSKGFVTFLEKISK